MDHAVTAWIIHLNPRMLFHIHISSVQLAEPIIQRDIYVHGLVLGTAASMHMVANKPKK